MLYSTTSFLFFFSLSLSLDSLLFFAQALGNGVLFSRSKYIVEEEIKPPKPNICVTVSQAHTKEQLEKAATVLKQALVKFDAAIKTN